MVGSNSPGITSTGTEVCGQSGDYRGRPNHPPSKGLRAKPRLELAAGSASFPDLAPAIFPQEALLGFTAETRCQEKDLKAGLRAAFPSCCVPVRHHMRCSKGSWGPGKGCLPPRTPGLLAERCSPGSGASLPPREGTPFPGQAYPAPSTHAKLQQDLIQHLHGLHACSLGLLGQVLGLAQQGDSEGTAPCPL